MLKFFKGKDKGNLIYAPCRGRVVPLAEVPDPVFADKVLGDGFAVIPADGRIYAPADGEVAMVFDTLHAVTLTSTQGGEIYEISSKTGKSVNASSGSTANLWYPHGYRIQVMSGNHAGWRHSRRSQSDRSVFG